MRIFFLVILFTFSILLIIGIIRIGRELHRIRALLEKGAERLEGYLTIILSDDASGEPDRIAPDPSKEDRQAVSAFYKDAQKPDQEDGAVFKNRQSLQLTNEEKKMLWTGETRQLFDEVIGDIF